MLFAYGCSVINHARRGLCLMLIGALYGFSQGQVEEEIKAMKFDNLFIYRPA